MNRTGLAMVLMMLGTLLRRRVAALAAVAALSVLAYSLRPLTTFLSLPSGHIVFVEAG